MLFEWTNDTPGIWRARYDVAPDGRFLMVAMDEETVAASRRITVVINWFEELKERVPTGGR